MLSKTKECVQMDIGRRKKKSYYCGFQTESLRRDSHGPWAASAANTWWHGRPVTVTRLIVSASVPRAWVPLLAPQRLLRSTFSAKKNPETALTSNCTRPSCPSSRGPTLPPRSRSRPHAATGAVLIRLFLRASTNEPNPPTLRLHPNAASSLPATARNASHSRALPPRSQRKRTATQVQRR
jgi:hypothetical protein